MPEPSVIHNYPGIAIVLEICFGTVACCLSGLVLCGYMKVHAWKKPSGLIVISLLVADIINGVNGPLQAAYIHCLLHDVKATQLFHTIFFFQSLFLWVSLLTIVLLNISRLVAILVPLRYTGVISMNTTRICLLGFWISGFVNSFLKRYVRHYNQFKYYVAGVLFHFILNVIILGLAVFTIIVLKAFGESSSSRKRATKTVIILSLFYVISYGYYIYVNIVYMIPGLSEHTHNEWIIFTATGKWALSLAHMFLLINSIFNGVILGLQPNIKSAINNIWIPNYYRYMLLQEANMTPATQ